MIVNIISIVGSCATVFSIAYMFYKYKTEEREKRRIKKISKYADNIAAYHFLEKIYIEEIHKLDNSQKPITIMRKCRKKMRDDYKDIDLLSSQQVQKDII